MDFLIEIVLELLFEGILEGAASKKLPIALRILLTAIPAAFLCIISALLFLSATRNRNTVLFAIAFGMLVFSAWFTVKIMKTAIKKK